MKQPNPGGDFRSHSSSFGVFFFLNLRDPWECVSGFSFKAIVFFLKTSSRSSESEKGASQNVTTDPSDGARKENATPVSDKVYTQHYGRDALARVLRLSSL